MPRAASSAKRHHGAPHSRDTRHENGLVGPGKRIAKQRSQGQLDGNANRLPAENGVPPPQLPSAVTNVCVRNPDEMAAEHKTTEALRRGSLGTYSESSSADSVTPLPASISHTQEETHRSINVNDAKNANVHRDPGPLDFAYTVLRSCPLHDTIAILIILMQVSPIALTTIYMLFTLLTFVPPVTTSSGLSITEIFDGNQGTPSLTTLLCMDVIMLGIWLFLFAPMQQFIMDLAQVVISLTLGGGGSSRQGTANNVFLCVAIVAFSHWSRYTKVSHFSRLGALLGSKFLGTVSDAPIESTVRSFEKKSSHGWIRNILAIHILTQGLVRYIREWYLRREKRDMQSHAQADPEAGKVASTTGDADGGLDTADPDPGHQQATAFLSTKKRRKQSAQVRIRQPLWAALASTKIVMVKEYELSHAASESAGSNATDIHNLGNAPFNTQPEQIWICYVGCDEVCFSTSHFPDPIDVEDRAEEDSKAGVDIRKPFYVRVNHAVWQPTRIIPIDDGEEDGQLGTRWTGDIYGLTPLSNYECEFVSTSTGQVIFSTSVRTMQAKSQELETATKSPGGQRSRVRRDSPATTLRASIAAAEAKLADEKARLKAVRKDNNRKLNAAKKEIEKLSAAVQSAGGNDEKLRQKVAQNNIQQRQAEQSIRELEDELKEFETIPEDLLDEYRTKQSSWTAEKAQFDGARASFKSFKGSIEKELKALEEEQATLKGKRIKIAARISKVDNEHARITDANARGLNEAERRRQERVAFETDAMRIEQNYTERIKRIRARNAEKQVRIQSMAAQMQAYLSTFQDEVTFDQAHAGVPAPYSSIPWAAPAKSSFSPQPSAWVPAAPPTLQAPAQLVPATQSFTLPNRLSTTIGTPPHKSRGRSSSMLSDVSGFTQSSDEDDRGSSGQDATTTASTGAMIPGACPGPSTVRGTPVSGPRSVLPFHLNQTPERNYGGVGSTSGSGSGSGVISGRSSVRSGTGSGSADSVHDPTSPI
ncbi:hypothetical protein VTK73DRAFT_5340 [Phialemonium thermophilum]|uniref:Ubiquitination network signaling protein n=1 Tax=Phialemonium thermophilum TaxID=223376 RepID=A0ABR3Y844_9PEZI